MSPQHDYDGSKTTSRQLKDLARRYLAHLEKKIQCKPAKVMEFWPQAIAPQFVSMTRATSFDEGVLYVTVSNSALLSLLHSSAEKKRLLEVLQEKIPEIPIQDIRFRLGSL